MSPIVVILLVLGGLFVLGVVGVVGAGVFFVHKAKQAGLDPDLMKKNPGLAAAKMIAAVNPDVEVVRVDEGSGKITLREKSSGKTITMDFDELKKGHITFSDESGKSGSLEIGSGKLPDWVPSYPGATGQGTLAAKGSEGEGGTYSFTTKDAASKVLEFYKDALKGAGMKIVTTTESDGPNGGGMIMSEDEGKTRSIMVTVGSGSDGTSVGLTYSKKP
jgi:hypothetical protein